MSAHLHCARCGRHPWCELEVTLVDGVPLCNGDDCAEWTARMGVNTDVTPPLPEEEWWPLMNGTLPTEHTQHCDACGEDYDARELDAVLFHMGDHRPETGATGLIGRRIDTPPEDPS